MENKSHAIAAGAFVLVVAAVLVAMAVWLTRDTGEHAVYEISSREGITGLQPQAGVRYRGVRVGRVVSIALDRETVGNVLIRIAVDEETPVTKTTFAALGFQGVTGLAFIQLDDAEPSDEPLLGVGDRPPRIPMRPSLLARLSDQGVGLLAELDQTTRRFNQLLAAPNQKKLMDAIDNLGQAAANISQLSAQANAVNLPVLVQETRATLTSLRVVSERLSTGAVAVTSSADAFKTMSNRMSQPGGTLDRIAEGTETLLATGQTLNATLVPRLNRTVDDAGRALRHMGRVVESVNDNPQALLLGNGTTPPGPGEPGFTPPQTR